MIHKTLITGAVALTLGMFVFGSNMWSYLQSTANNVRESVKSSVPFEMRIETAADMVEEILPEIRRHKQLVAKQQVELKYQQEAITKTRTELESQKKAILALREMLQDGKQTYQFARHAYTATEVESDVSQRFERFKIAEDALTREQEVFEAKRKALRSNEQALDQMMNQKKTLEAQVIQLQARLNQLRATESVKSMDIDDSQLVRTRQMINELNKELDIQERVLDEEGEFVGLIPVEEELEHRQHPDLLSEIDSYFDDTPAEEQKSEEKTGPTAAEKADTAESSSVDPDLQAAL
ncbi:hypothetical protein Pla110_46370 [Polystyrenella longa]|uniref:Uncharacterized protein n=1 Tax=Polystyrenella longa TaxID=2528007 RepID=A0A518CUL3_9PLAN|nr:hypothetical protein [Polystyrenella longa]QDU82874.1 hypothetical protein Pla110_46370 [Polystyrenella longa]